jgi:hypothetical protein
MNKIPVVDDEHSIPEVIKTRKELENLRVSALKDDEDAVHTAQGYCRGKI